MDFKVRDQTSMSSVRSKNSKDQEDIFIDDGKLNNRDAVVIRKADRIEYTMSGIVSCIIEKKYNDRMILQSMCKIMTKSATPLFLNLSEL